MSELYCITCGEELCNDDIGFHKKMVNRGATEFMCVKCLSEYFGLTEEKSRELIARFRSEGCTLFP